MLIALGIVVLVIAGLASLPYWLPQRVVRLRTRVFAAVNGDEGISVPGPQIGMDDFLLAYADPAAGGRSRGAALSDLFWYWLAPGPHVHQEHLEAGPRYDEAAKTTRRILIKPKAESEELTARVAERVLDEIDAPVATLVRLRDAMMPIWAELYYELVFAEPCPPEARELIVGNADDVVTALKCTGLRHMRRRGKLTDYLHRRIVAGDVPHELPSTLSTMEQAYYLQGTFFNTAVVQMSEGMAHLLLAIAEHPDVQARLVADPDDSAYLEAVIDESLRTYPLFGIAHRILTADVHLPDQTVPAGSVLCFSYAEFHQQGYPHPTEFRPDRWADIAAKDVNFIPFGVTANRPCPARGLAPLTMRVVARAVLDRFELASSVAHTRSLPNRGPALFIRRRAGLGARARRSALAFLRARDRWEDVYRGIAQLIFGSYMVWDARRKALCRNYFASLDTPLPTATGCPVPHGMRTT
ncbi:MAG TPA: cytochrome P450 [Pseudonocardiaceae bacterium]|jgi:hypothetical protein|nr:cytochrome P450 [Pseudonocardiaceae bacterium]